jgi:hypothetical protein
LLIFLPWQNRPKSGGFFVSKRLFCTSAQLVDQIVKNPSRIDGAPHHP